MAWKCDLAVELRCIQCTTGRLVRSFGVLPRPAEISFRSVLTAGLKAKQMMHRPCPQCPRRPFLHAHAGRPGWWITVILQYGNLIAGNIALNILCGQSIQVSPSIMIKLLLRASKEGGLGMDITRHVGAAAHAHDNGMLS